MNTASLRLAILTGGLLLTGLAHSTELDGFYIEYDIRYMGLRAEATLQLKPADTDGEYFYEVRSRARGLARLLRSSEARESTRFRLTETGIEPLRYSLDDGGDADENNTVITFDWEAGTAASVYEQEPADIQLEPGVQDRLSADIAVILDLRSGREPGRYAIAEKNQIRQADYTDLGEEQAEVPAGTFDTRKFRRQRPGSSRSTLIWYAADAAWLPVRIEQQKDGKTNVTMVATLVEPQS